MTDVLQRSIDQGMRMLATKRFDQASELAATLLSQHRGDGRVHLFAADVAAARGDHTRALALLDELSSAEQQNARLLVRKAHFLLAARRRADARATALSAANLAVNGEWQLRTIAHVLRDCLDIEGARAWLSKVRIQLPGNAGALWDLALAEFQLDRVADAERHIGELLQLNPVHAGAIHLRSALRTWTETDNHVADLESRLGQMSENARYVAACCYALAKEYEDLEQFDRSFAALMRGAQTYRGTIPYDSVAELASHQAIRERFTSEAFAALEPGFDATGPVFVIGMPRTGTTLVERILGSHSMVSSVGELPDFPDLLAEVLEQVTAAEADRADASLGIDFAQLGRRYIESARQVAGNSPHFVDKLPFNFLYCGYILAALPNARLIQLRRDPLDTCYAAFKTMFFQAYHFSYDLDELADYVIDFHRHMQHWQRVFPGRILDVDYEDLVREPEAQCRRMLEFCELPWENGVLEFYRQTNPVTTASAVQVRRPLYTDSIGAWRRAAAGFDRVRSKLVEAGLVSPTIV